MVCPQCRAAAPDGKKFCGECGAALATDAVTGPIAVPGEDGAFYCAKHVKAVTRLRCGRCEMPICPKCTVPTPAGMRCRACAKNKIAVRPAGVLHGAVGLISSAAPGVGRRVWYLALWYFLLSFLRGPFE
jgi:hypothetical protein